MARKSYCLSSIKNGTTWVYTNELLQVLNHLLARHLALAGVALAEGYGHVAHGRESADAAELERNLEPDGVALERRPDDNALLTHREEP